MHTCLPTFAAHLPSAAWGGAAIDAGIHALLGASPLAKVALGDGFGRDLSAEGAHWERFRAELGAADGTAMLDVGKLYTESVLLLRAIAASDTSVEAAEVLTLAPATAGDLSALPPHSELSAHAMSQGGVVILREPRSSMTAVVAIPPARTEHVWNVRLFSEVPMAPQAPSISHATAELTDSVHGAAEIIAASSGAFRAGEGSAPAMPENMPTDLPSAFGGRAAQLIERADTIENIRMMANAAESRRGAPAEQQPALWKLQSAVNLARRAAVSGFAAEQLEQFRARSGSANSPAYRDPNAQSWAN
ncbi:MAG TPA: hypothetical protein K8V11_11055 [Dietzia timorensis]|uniref:Uncharacterized protein n=1 Tax=Dietzia timorensis TaxID=499555 RepID=A0A921F4L0_9ACTN|nr:hypothetical protein [Dietzia timorensis]HJE91531.1 hypothetical protein [Dietzia timorensis]